MSPRGRKRAQRFKEASAQALQELETNRQSATVLSQTDHRQVASSAPAKLVEDSHLTNKLLCMSCSSFTLEGLYNMTLCNHSFCRACITAYISVGLCENKLPCQTCDKPHKRKEIKLVPHPPNVSVKCSYHWTSSSEQVNLIQSACGITCDWSGYLDELKHHESVTCQVGQVIRDQYSASRMRFPENKGLSSLQRVISLFPFRSEIPNTIQFSPGQSIRFLTRKGPWAAGIIGEFPGFAGWFPAAFVAFADSLPPKFTA